MSQPELQIFPNLAALQESAAKQIAALSAEAVAERGKALVALSGGSAPPGIYQHLLRQPLNEQMPWANLSLIWADERMVPLDHPDSNYFQARPSLLDHASIPANQIYAVPTDAPSAEEAAAIYQRQVAALLEAHSGQIDLLLLGMGPDGHTASLFPGHPELHAPPEQLVIAVHNSPKPPPTRVSLTPSALNSARIVIFIVAGADKAANVRAALRDPADPARIPAQVVAPPAGRVIWLLDEAAAAQL